MSRYTIADSDLVITVGMDFACQFYATDHRGTHFPMDLPAKMTVKDMLGQTLFETEGSPGAVDDPAPDPLTDAIILASPEAGMLQVTIPRIMSAEWYSGINYYDIWATIYDTEAQLTTAGGSMQPLFPTGQQLPIAKGRFIIRDRTTVMEEY